MPGVWRSLLGSTLSRVRQVRSEDAESATAGTSVPVGMPVSTASNRGWKPPYRLRVGRLTLLVSYRRCQPFALEPGVLRFGWGIALWV